MSGQTKLLAFFQPSTKRCSSGSKSKSPKKIKLDKENVKNSEGEVPETPMDEFNQIYQAPNLQSKLVLTPSNEQLINEMEAYSEKYPVLGKKTKIGPSWFRALKDEFDKPYFKKLDSFVEAERSKYTVYPPEDQVWSWTRQCSIHDIKVVILGQDPYHNPGQAHGLCFSVPIGIPPPPSLLNMYKELESDIENFKNPNHGYLVGWARQGVLLLNAVLTVRKNSANSHKDQGWEELTTAVIKHINENNSGVVFLLWGAYAQKKAAFVDQKKHLILKTVHPSPLSASRGWFGCKHFSKSNDYLKSKNKRPIDWNKLPKI